jgi:NAD(P)H-dependent FMN reductase
MAPSALKVGIILGSTRKARMGERVARWIHRLAVARGDLDVELVDLKDWPLPNYEDPVGPKQAELSYTTVVERGWVAKINGFDAFILVTPEYNHGYPAPLKNALDHVYSGWNHKPVAFVSYGGSSGGVRAVQQLRQVAIELQMAPLRDEVNIPFVSRAFDDAGEPHDAFHGRRAATMFDQLTWWTAVLKEGRAAHPVRPPQRNSLHK